MIRVYLCCPNRKEMVIIVAATIKKLQQLGETFKPVCTFTTDDLRQQITGIELVETDVLVCDITALNAVKTLELLRKQSKEMKIVVLADNTVPPTEYIRPAVLPTSLLWRPVTDQSVSATMGEIIALLRAQEPSPLMNAEFSVEVRGNIKRVSYQNILYFEAREKKLWVHMNHTELSFAGTLEKLIEELPGDFIRIHKSFIVNRAHTVELQYGQNLLRLSDGTILPISRSYKTEVKVSFS